MPNLNLQRADNTNYAALNADVIIPSMQTDGTTNQDETVYVNNRWSKWWGYFNQYSDLKSAMLMKAVWIVGKGFNADPNTLSVLDGINGWGKETFEDILFNLVVTMRISGDAYAEIIRDDEGEIKNLLCLDPSAIRIVVGRDKLIKRYELITKLPNNTESVIKYKPEEILHLSHNRLADQIHGISDIQALEPIILAENEAATDTKQLMHFQARPFILWKLKTDKPEEIAAFKAKIENAKKYGNDTFIPDDEDAVSYEIVQLSPNAMILEWQRHNTQKFYRALGMPLIVFGNGGTTESGGKIEYLAHEQVFAKDQRFLEKQLWNQLQLKLKLNPPTSLLDNLQTDQAKDGPMQQMNMQQSDVTAGSGR